jgi:hypothetical protein
MGHFYFAQIGHYHGAGTSGREFRCNFSDMVVMMSDDVQQR